MAGRSLMGHHLWMTLRLLIVDDSEVIFTSLRALLGSVAGIPAIREAKSLSEELASVRADPPALVILDKNLPDGAELNGTAMLSPL